MTPADIALANRLAHDILGKTLDELPPQTRQLLSLIYRMVTAACTAQHIEQSHFRFSRKQIREFSGWGNTQLKIHCKRLEDMEYLLIHRGGRGQSFDYELLYQGEGEQGNSFVLGLLDAAQLKNQRPLGYDNHRSGHEASGSGSSRPQVGGVSVEKKAENVEENSGFIALPAHTQNNVHLAV